MNSAKSYSTMMFLLFLALLVFLVLGLLLIAGKFLFFVLGGLILFGIKLLLFAALVLIVMRLWRGWRMNNNRTGDWRYDPRFSNSRSTRNW